MSKARRRFIRYGILGLGLLIVAAVSMTAFAPEDGAIRADRPEFAPMNPEYVRYINDKKAGRPWPTMTEDGHPLGLIPAPIDLSHIKADPRFDNADRLVAKYDLRTKNKLTPIKDQGSAGTCWTFATFGSLESYLKPGAIWDFSEQNLVDNHGFDYGVNDGGHMWMAAAYLARWSGPLKETQDPYQYAVIDGVPPSKHVQKIIFGAKRASSTDNTLIKNYVMTYGAVAVSMAWSSSAYRDATKAYYHSGSWTGGHAVCVVGWDDSFSKSKFASTPPGNGAFIVRNSWGSNWGESGYFYVSYYDSQFGRVNCNAVVFGEPTTNYKGIYQYDTLGWVASAYTDSPASTKWFANIFTATAKGSIKAVSFYTGANSNPYEIYVYTGVASNQPRSGNLKKTVKGTVAFPGYVTIPLGSLVPVNSGQKFSIVVKLTTKNYNYPIPIEYRASGYTSAATAKTGQSFVSSNGTSWTDTTKKWSNANVCLKAFTQ
jgi:C1A family cysteine protease